MPRWEDLGNNCRVLVSEDYGFTTDTLLLAHFSMPRPGEACADLGTGCGAIPLLWKSRGASGEILAVELQREAAELAQRSVEENGYDIRVICGDVREYRKLLPHQALDAVACNPPYFTPGSGAAGEGPRKTARCGETFSLEDLARAAGYSLRGGGRLSLCLPTARLAEVLALFRDCRLEPKRLRLVQHSPRKAPYLFLLECRKEGRPGLSAEPVLFLTDGEGRDTPELIEIYGAYRNGEKL